MAYAIDPENFLSLDTFYDAYKIPSLEQFVDTNAKRCLVSMLVCLYVWSMKYRSLQMHSLMSVLVTIKYFH